MRTLRRNARPIWYALKTGEKSNMDDYGNETGEVTPIYGSPVSMMCNVSSAVGEDAVEAFGSFTGYSRTISVADTKCPIDEHSVIWFGIEPTEPHNYIVVRKADSKNGILYALREVIIT